MNEEIARAELCRIGRSLFERGYVHATAGNLSARLDGDAGYLITPTDACLGFIEPQELVHVRPDGLAPAGARPSKTVALHRRVYAAEPAAQCVVHTHSTHCVAASLSAASGRGELLPPITPYFVMKVGRVPLIAYHRPGDPRAADLVAAAIERGRTGGAPLRAVMLDRLGPIVWHETPAAAMAALEELEETARLWWLSGGRVPPLDGAQIDELAAHFGARW